jgi:hypothetical protein
MMQHKKAMNLLHTHTHTHTHWKLCLSDLWNRTLHACSSYGNPGLIADNIFENVFFIAYDLFELGTSLDVPSHAVTCRVVCERRDEKKQSYKLYKWTTNNAFLWLEVF